MLHTIETSGKDPKHKPTIGSVGEWKHRGVSGRVQRGLGEGVHRGLRGCGGRVG